MNSSQPSRRRHQSTLWLPLPLWVVILGAFPTTVVGSLSSPELLPAGVATTTGATNGYFNPAALGHLPGDELELFWSPDTDHWDFFTGGPLFGSAHHGYGIRSNGDSSEQRYGISLGNGLLGISRGWSNTRTTDDTWTVGSSMRPNDRFAVEMSSTWSDGSDGFDLRAGAGLRPLGSPTITIGGECAWNTDDTFEWASSIAVEPTDGIRLVSRLNNHGEASLGLRVSLGRWAWSAHANEDGGAETRTLALRYGSRESSAIERRRTEHSRYLNLDLEGPIGYQRYKLFDETHSLLELLTAIDHAATDPRIGGVAVKLSGTSIGRVPAWELRKSLSRVREAGKPVVAYLDQAGTQAYHLASVADRVIIDPTGTLMLPGEAMGRTYLRGALEKMGVGVDEFRFFTYKSAFEGLSRESMSVADSVQRQALVDGFFDEFRSEVSASRPVDERTVNHWIENMVLFSSMEAVAEGLADTTGRWGAVEALLEELAGQPLAPMTPAEAGDQPNAQWGPPARIAVVYALGECAMDSGIRARTLGPTLEAVGNDTGIEAVVLRVDSPGGDVLASDIVAEALRSCGENKPIVVSQGTVAASGGYWISMYADTIVAAPATITGSIGVIGGWIWNNGLGEKMGLSTDHVQVGSHADLEAGLVLPLLGAELPNRPLKPNERGRAEHLIRSFYEDFLERVAEGRGMTTAEVDSVAQGRVWTGRDGQGVGLVDILGGLDDAIRIASVMAGISENDDMKIVEYPDKDLLPPSLFTPSLVSTSDAEWRQIHLMLNHPAQPLALTPVDLLPSEASH